MENMSLFWMHVYMKDSLISKKRKKKRKEEVNPSMLN